MSKNDEPSVSTEELLRTVRAVSTEELLRVAREQSLRVAVELEDFLRMLESFHSANSMVDLNADRRAALMEMMSVLRRLSHRAMVACYAARKGRQL